jgi:type I restriction enzyme R subunit
VPASASSASSPTSLHDFARKPRLNNDRGTAILVAASIYDACHYFRLFQGHVVSASTAESSHRIEPNHNAISREPANSDERYKYDTYTQHVLKRASNHRRSTPMR